MPMAVYFMAWIENWAIDLQTNARATLNDPWVQNRRTPPPADTRPPTGPIGWEDAGDQKCEREVCSNSMNEPLARVLRTQEGQ
jgi:hypothetical protein